MTTNEPASRSTDSVPDTTKDSSRKTIVASDIGITLTLTISDKALQEFDRLQEKAFKASQEDRKFSWR